MALLCGFFAGVGIARYDVGYQAVDSIRDAVRSHGGIVASDQRLRGARGQVVVSDSLQRRRLHLIPRPGQVKQRARVSMFVILGRLGRDAPDATGGSW